VSQCVRGQLMKMGIDYVIQLDLFKEMSETEIIFEEIRQLRHHMRRLGRVYMLGMVNWQKNTLKYMRE